MDDYNMYKSLVLFTIALLQACSGGSGSGSPQTGTPPVLVTGAYFVSPTGSADWNTSRDNPDHPTDYATAMTNAIAGDTVYFRGGNYTPDYTGTDAYTPAMYPANNGNSTQPITFIAYPTETPVIIASNNNDAAAFGCLHNSYIIWDGFSGQLANTSSGYNTSWLAVLQESDHCQITHGHFTGVTQGTPSSGGNAAPIRIEVCDSCSVTYSEIYGNYGTTESYSVNVTGIWIFESIDTEIAYNHIHHNSNGIMQKNGINLRPNIHHNYFHDINYMAVHLKETVENSLDGIIDNNVIANSRVGVFLEATGLNAVTGLTAYTTHYSVFNNTITDCNTGIQFSAYTVNGSAHDNIIANCTVPIRYYTVQPITSDYNCFYNFSFFNQNYTTDSYTLDQWQTATNGGDTHSIVQNPLFDLTHGTTPDSYALLQATPCINSATDLVMGADTSTVGLQ